jgi:hypothetical protein
MDPYNEDELAKIPRKTGAEILAEARIGDDGGKDRLAMLIDIALNQEWWRGKYAGLNEPKPVY